MSKGKKIIKIITCIFVLIYALWEWQYSINYNLAHWSYKKALGCYWRKHWGEAHHASKRH